MISAHSLSCEKGLKYDSALPTDSACTMGRIAWFDALARRRYGDLETFDNVLLNRLRDDLRDWTWMHER